MKSHFFSNIWMWQFGFPVNFLEIWIQLLVITFGIKIYFPRCEVNSGHRDTDFGCHYLMVTISKSLSKLTIRDTNTKSNMLGPLVGESTICTSKLSWRVSRNFGSRAEVHSPVSQLMFLKLKSPIEITFFVSILSMSQQILSRIWSWSTSRR